MQTIQRLIILFLCSSVVSKVLANVPMPPPEPSLRKSPAAWMGFGLIFIFFAVVVTINLMSSKRGHQD
jgi:hypothetical protein